MDNQPLYSLTKMTGREASSARTVVVGVVDVSWRVLVIIMAALLTGLPIMAMLWTLLGSMAVVVLIIWVIGAVWLFHGRTQRGLRIHNFAALLNRRRAVINRFLLGPSMVHVPHDDWRVIGRGSLDNPELRVLPEDLPRQRRETQPIAVAAAIFDSPGNSR